MITWLRGIVALLALNAIMLVLAGSAVAQASSATEAVDQHCLSEYTAQEPGIATAAQISAATKALRANPDDIDALMQRASVYRSVGYLEDALADYDQILELEPEYTDNEFACNRAITLMLFADDLNRSGDSDLALEAIALALEADPSLPTYAPVYVHRGEAYIALDRLPEALDDFNHAIETLNSGRAYAGRGIVYQLQGRLDEALDDMNKALELDSTYYYSYYVRSQLLLWRGDFEGALDDLNILIEKMPFANAYVNRGALYIQMGNYEAAMSDFDVAMERDSENVFLYINRGNLYYALGQYDEALADETEAIRLDPSRSGGFLYRSYVYMALGEFDAALDDVNRAIELEPSLQTYYWRARVHSAREEYEAALDDLAILLDAAPSLVEGRVFRAFIYQQQANYEAALTDFDQVIALVPANAIYYDYRASVYVKLGDDEKALDDFNRAIELDPSAMSYVQRANGYDEMDNHDAALEDFARAIELAPTNFNLYLSRGASHNEAGEHEEGAADYLEWMHRNETESIEEDRLEYGDSLTLELAQGRIYRIPFEGRAGQTIRITADTADGVRNDPLLVMLGAGEKPLVSDDDSGGDLNALIENYRLPRSGQYWIVLSHAGGGSDGRVTVTLNLAE